jgi:hypothetical protein
VRMFHMRFRICYYTTKRNAHYAINYVSYTTRFGFEPGSPSCPTNVQEPTTTTGNASRSASGYPKRDRDLHYVAKLQAIYKSIFLGSSMNSLILTKNVTASRPSSSLWSYVRARYIIWHIH